MEKFLLKLADFPRGNSQGLYEYKRYGANLSVSTDKKRYKLYAEELGGTDFISFNLYVLKEGNPLLKPCEMPAQKVMDFVINYNSL